MDGDFVSRLEHDEFAKRLDEANKRQDTRLGQLEAEVKDLNTLTAAVGRIATSVEDMVTEQKAQGERLTKLEGRDGEKWRKVVGYAVSALICGLVGFALARFGLAA